MKKYLLKLTALVLLVGLGSCSEDKVFYDEGNAPALARFVDASRLMGVTEIKKEKFYPVQVSTISNVDRKITVSIDPTGSSENIGEYIEIVAAESFIPAGSYDGNIKVRFKKEYADLTFDNDLTAILIIDAVEGASVEENNRRMLLTIFKDCDYNPAAVGTSFTAEAVANAYGSGFPGASPEPYQPTVTPVAGKTNEFALNTLWGPNFVGTVAGNPSYNGNPQLFNPGRLIIDTQENTVTVVGNDPSLVIDGTGTYDACNNVFTYTFTQGLFDGIPFTVTVTLTPIQ